jgi:hypothetical protein
MNPDHAQVDAAFLNYESADPGVTLKASGGHDLEPDVRDHVAADEACDRHPFAPNVRLDMCLGTDHQVAITFDVSTEIAQDLSAALDLEPSRKDIVRSQDRRLRLLPIRLGAAIRAGNLDRLR